MRLLIVAVFTLMTFGEVNAQLNRPEREGRPERTEEKDETSYKDKKFIDRLSVGGSLGLGYSNGWLIDIQPMAGYRFNNFLMAGLTAQYTYISNDIQNRRFNLYGGGPFLRVRPFSWFEDDRSGFLSSLIGQVQGQFLGASDDRGNTGSYNTMLAGGGYHSTWESGSSFYLLILVDVFYDRNTSLNSTPLIYQFGYMYNF